MLVGYSILYKISTPLIIQAFQRCGLVLYLSLVLRLENVFGIFIVLTVNRTNERNRATKRDNILQHNGKAEITKKR